MAAPTSKPVVAVFDFDGTLTWADSFTPFLREAAGPATFWPGALALAPVLAAHVLGAKSSHDAKEAFIRRFLRGWTAQQLEAAAVRFAAGPRLARLLNPVAMERLRWHRQQGHRVLLLSASPELYLRHWSAAHGIATTLGTRLEMDAGACTGRIAGRNCHGGEKLARLRAELGDLAAFELHAYGDSRADLALLDVVEHPGFRSFHCKPGFLHAMRAALAFLRALV